MIAASQSKSTPLIEMMLESARREAEAGAYEYAIEYVLAVIAVESKLVPPRLDLQDLALSLLSSARLRVPYVNPIRASVLSSRLRQNRELIGEQFVVDEIASNLLDEQESKVILALARDLTGTSVPRYEIETCAEAITLKTARLLQSIGISDAVARLVEGNNTSELRNRPRLGISSRQYLAFAACITLLIAVGSWLYLAASRERARSLVARDAGAPPAEQGHQAHSHFAQWRATARPSGDDHDAARGSKRAGDGPAPRSDHRQHWPPAHNGRARRKRRPRGISSTYGVAASRVKSSSPFASPRY